MNITGYKRRLKNITENIKLEMSKQFNEQNQFKLKELNFARIKIRNKIRTLKKKKC